MFKKLKEYFFPTPTFCKHCGGRIDTRRSSECRARIGCPRQDEPTEVWIDGIDEDGEEELLPMDRI